MAWPFKSAALLPTARTPRQREEFVRELDRLEREMLDDVEQEINCWCMYGIPVERHHDEVAVDLRGMGRIRG